MRTPVTPTHDVRSRRLARTVEGVQRRGPQSWVYVGTYPTDPFTSYWSPAWTNGWTYDGQRVAFRWGLNWQLEFKGRYDSTGATTGTSPFTLPEEWRPDEEFSYLTDLDQGAGAFSAARIVVPTTGVVVIYFPIA